MQTIAWNGMKWGREDFFLLIQTLPTFWATQILILNVFLEFVDPTFPEFHAPGFQNWRIIIVPTETGGVY